MRTIRLQWHCSRTPAVYYYDGSSDKLVHINASPSVEVAHDLNGNITAENAGTYEYDLSNQLIRVRDSGLAAAYTYNGEGQRIKKVTVVNPHLPLRYRRSSHRRDRWQRDLAAEYVYLDDQLLAMIKPEVNLMYYYHNDHLATPRVLTDNTANVVWSALYTAFGQAQLSVADRNESSPSAGAVLRYGDRAALQLLPILQPEYRKVRHP